MSEYSILDTDPEPRYDGIAKIVARAFDVPMAFISLINEDRHWTKAGVGYSGSIARDITFCTHAIEADEALVVPDATVDSRFADNPLVVPADGVRFYAGAPLRVPGGHRLGTVCAVDVRPREASPQLIALLSGLAAQVVDLLELGRRSRRLAAALESAKTLGELIPICSHCRKVRHDDEFWSSLEGYMSQRAGTRFAQGSCPDCEPPAPAALGGETLPSDFDERAGEIGAEAKAKALEAAVRELSLSDVDRSIVLEALAAQRAEIAELRRVSKELSVLLSNIRTLGEMVPLCSGCGKVRQDEGYWSSLEDFVAERAGSRFSHGMCPGCVREHYPDIADAVLGTKR